MDFTELPCRNFLGFYEPRLLVLFEKAGRSLRGDAYARRMWRLSCTTGLFLSPSSPRLERVYPPRLWRMRNLQRAL